MNKAGRLLTRTLGYDLLAKQIDNTLRQVY